MNNIEVRAHESLDRITQHCPDWTNAAGLGVAIFTELEKIYTILNTQEIVSAEARSMLFGAEHAEKSLAKEVDRLSKVHTLRKEELESVCEYLFHHAALLLMPDEMGKIISALGEHGYCLHSKPFFDAVGNPSNTKPFGDLDVNEIQELRHDIAARDTALKLNKEELLYWTGQAARLRIALERISRNEADGKDANVFEIAQKALAP